jgi:hypothetical protein
MLKLISRLATLFAFAFLASPAHASFIGTFGVPEPSPLALITLGIAAVGLVTYLRKRRK